MDFLWDFVLTPTPENFNIIQTSTKLKNLIGPPIESFTNAVLCKYGTEWKNIALTADHEMFARDTIDVIAKLVASPRLGLLHKAWCLFWATGELKFLKSAFEVAGNMRASNSLKHEAIKIYNQNQEIFDARDDSKNTSPCVIAWREFGQILFENQHKLRELHKDTKQEMMNISPMQDEQTKLLADAKNISTFDSKKYQKDAEIADASALFDEVAHDIFSKIK